MRISYRLCTEYRIKEIYGQLKKDIGTIIRKLCDEKKVKILAAEACPDQIHMLVIVPPYLSTAQFVGFLKGKNPLMIYDRHANLKYKYGSRSFWCRGYYANTVGRNERVISEYIKTQLENDRMTVQISISECKTRIRVSRISRQKRQPRHSGCQR